MNSVVPRDRSLVDLFSRARTSDLEVLADIITDRGNGRVALDAGAKALILECQKQGTLRFIPKILEVEICAYGSNSLDNLFKSKARSYEEIAIDVAKNLGGKPSSDDDIFAIEDMVTRQAEIKYKSKGAGGVAPSDVMDRIIQGLISQSGASIASIVSTDVMVSMVGATIGRVAAIAAPPLAVGAAVYTVYNAVGPAFRIAIPAVLQIAKIRRSQFDADFAAYTEGLRACL